MVFFSVIIPTYNRANLIEKTVDSVLNQDYRDREIIIVDDGSKDNTLDVLKKYKNQVRVLRQNNQGAGAARNLGLKFANGQYITFLDSDDLWFPWTLNTYKKVILDTNFPAFVAGKELNFFNEQEILSVSQSQLEVTLYNDYYASAYEDIWIGTCSTAIKKDTLDQVGGYCNQNINAEDSDLWLRLGNAKGFVYINSPYLFAYRRHEQSEVSNLDKSYQGKLYIINKEKTQQYSGGKERKRERLYIITRHTRSMSFACLKQGEIQKGWRIYQNTFFWNLRLIRVRYLLGFLLITTKKILELLIKKISLK
ncbi:glycosyltransferase family 2 protein [Geminocystis herdmanii]|uniref:glycosyltransferase family 2 protein n=1 Tax=Geminocystis herdmanii TaxID=669359 RepID=UPI0003451851|nr:glycosyltransferase family A protein [Geminocystis herdmanii]